MVKFNFTAQEYQDDYEIMIYNHDKYVLKEILFKISNLFKEGEVKEIKWTVCALETGKATLFTNSEIHFKFLEHSKKWFKNGAGNILEEVKTKELMQGSLGVGLIKSLDFEKTSDCIIYELKIFAELFNWSNHFVNIGYFDKSDFWKKTPIENGEDILYVDLNSQNYIDAVLCLIGDELFKAETKRELLESSLLEKK